MYVGVLGPLEVHDDSGPVAIAGTRVRRLLIRLAVDAGRAVSFEELVDAVWPDDPPGQAGNALQALVSRLRRALTDGPPIETAGTGYRWTLAPDCVDAHRFGTLARHGRDHLAAGRPDAAHHSLADAVALWRGDPLPDAADATYAEALRVHWQDTLVQARADLAAADLDLGRGADHVGILDELVRSHPMRADLVELQLRALRSAGRTAEALTAYDAHRRHLAETLGSDPEPSTQALYLELLQPPLVAEPAATTVAARSDIPLAVTRLVGREADVERLTKLLADNRLVTLVGPGGAGKTRLASDVLRDAVDRSAAEAWFVDLAPVTDELGVERAFTRLAGHLDRHVLDIPGEPAVLDPTDRLVAWLDERPVTLLVDNCEQVVGPAAAFVHHLLTRCARLTVLATSRESLGIPGEAVHQLSALALPEPGADAASAMGHAAVQLFLERATQASADLELTDATVATVVDVVRRLDGLPLALELAAARLRALPLAELERRLADRFRLLTTGNRAAAPRHQTLRAVVSWSWDLLGEPERLLLERLAVFPSGATAEDARAVGAGGPVDEDAADDLLASLVDKSLLRVAEEGDDGLRYRMLDTIRAYGLEQLGGRGEAGAARLAHARHFAALVAQVEPALRTADQLDALRVLARERANILAALQFFGDEQRADEALRLVWHLTWYWTMVGGHAESAYWGRFALAVEGPADPRLRAIVEMTVALTAMSTPDPAEEWAAVEARLRDVSVAAERFDFDEPTLVVLMLVVAHLAGRADRARDLAHAAASSSDPWLRAATRTLSATMAENDGDLAAMRAELDAAADDLGDVGDRWLVGSSLATRARLLTLDGELEQAASDLQRAAASLAEIGALDDVVFAWLRLAELAIRQGDFGDARRCIDRLADAAAQWPPAELFRTALLARLARHEGDRAMADRLYEDLSAQLAAVPDEGPMLGHVRAVMLASLASYDVWRGRIEEAFAQVSDAYRRAVGTRDMPIIAVVGVATADVAVAAGEPVDATRRLAWSAAVRGADDPTDPEVARLLSGLRARVGDRFDALYDDARRLSREDAVRALDPAGLAVAVRS